MKAEAIALALRSQDPVERTNLLREYLQARALRSLHESRAFEQLSFVGGTALRFLYELPRYSEDLDFSLERAEGYDPLPWLAKLKRDLERLGFEADIAWNARKTVHVAWIRVAGILAEAHIVERREQKLSVKLEIDTRPPAGAVMEKTLVNRQVILALRHHDLGSLMAGKVHALLTRPFAKGRDWYDLQWYRARRPPVEPNPTFLQAALQQTGTVLESSWSEAIARKAASVDFSAIRADVEPFLEQREEAQFLTKEAFVSI